MGVWSNQMKGQTTAGKVDEELWGDLILEIPEVIDAFTGSVDADGRWKRGPCTVMMFVEGSKLKFCLSPKFSSSVAFGVIPDPDKPFHSMEAELNLGHFEWKHRTKGK